ncbi:enoyl-CoA hydratase/isomerase family protein [Herbaspirillum sp. alder98]|uniref:enoyl-CoA hydratase/isomerase family protein n=1 Tax=Herbaspirillum sp. alder98 TaxID=2913096 RepID=UPI001CD851EF|nr:enoyl-CoA hydratase/isomerase family protein [Herbaspirillum sp. alder98]MCA1326068.1 enoyl-CoA hydratase/isomerase family protein [Herbaspirillum sp. alder98]
MLTSSRIHFIHIDNAPVNGLSHAVRAGIVGQLDAAEKDERITAIVLVGAGKVFSGGADMREFGTDAEAAEPHLNTVIARLEDCRKPVVAVLHGVAMGGGLELAMGCHFRLVTPSCKIALPEVKLGLMPGGGGTQRLPRLTGLDMAVKVIVSGDVFNAQQFAGTALFDAVIEEGDNAAIEAQAAAFVAALSEATPMRRTRDREVPGGDGVSALAQARSEAQAVAQWTPAPLKCIEAIAASRTHAFTRGLETERALFLWLLESRASVALRYQFFAERAVSKIGDLAPGTRTSLPSSIVLIGDGAQIDYLASMLARSSIPVARFASFQHALAALDDAGMVVLGDMDDAGEVARLLVMVEQRVAASCVLVSLSHCDDLDLLAQQLTRPTDLAGLYVGEPGDQLSVVEVVRGSATSAATAAILMAFCKHLGKTGVVSPSRPGLIGPRLLARLMRQKRRLQETGVPGSLLDQALREFGYREGPCLRAAADADADQAYAGHIQKRPPLADIAAAINGALGDEAAALLAGSAPITATDIDIVFTLGYGFPRHCGGPLFYHRQQ